MLQVSVSSRRHIELLDHHALVKNRVVGYLKCLLNGLATKEAAKIRRFATEAESRPGQFEMDGDLFADPTG